MIIDQLNSLPTPIQNSDEFAVERGTTTYKMPFSAVGTSINESITNNLHGMKVYTDVTQLGLTSGSATISEVFAAMGNNNVFEGSAGQFASGETPSSYGVVEIFKSVGGARSYIKYYGKDLTNSAGDYRMYLNTDSTVTGVWNIVRDGTNSQMAIYNRISAIGLSGTQTIAAIYAALPDRSIIEFNVDRLAEASLPKAGWVGTIVINRLSSVRTYIMAYGKTVNGGDYRMFLDNTPAPDGVWHKVGMNMIEWTTSQSTTVAAHSTAPLTTVSNAGLPDGATVLAIHLMPYSQAGTADLIAYKQKWYSTESIAVANPTDAAITVPSGFVVQIVYTVI